MVSNPETSNVGAGPPGPDGASATDRRQSVSVPLTAARASGTIPRPDVGEEAADKLGGRASAMPTAQSSAGVAGPKLPAGAGGLSATDAIRQANQELQARGADSLALPIAILIEQRDAALAASATVRAAADAEMAGLVEEHDRFVAFLMEEQDGKAEALERELKETQAALARQRTLAAAAPEAATTSHAQAKVAEPAPEQLADLRRLLEIAYSELDQAKALVPSLEEERDAALRAADDVRIELYTEVETARDEGIALQGQLDDARRQLEEARDNSRDEALDVSARLDEARRELDERRDEVSRLRARMTELTEEVKHSRPPPPMVSEELTRSREEAQALRKELIETKRQLSRVMGEHKLLRTQRARAVGGVGLKPSPVEVAASHAIAYGGATPGLGGAADDASVVEAPGVSSLVPEAPPLPTALQIAPLAAPSPDVPPTDDVTEMDALGHLREPASDAPIGQQREAAVQPPVEPVTLQSAPAFSSPPSMPRPVVGGWPPPVAVPRPDAAGYVTAAGTAPAPSVGAMAPSAEPVAHAAPFTQTLQSPAYASGMNPPLVGQAPIDAGVHSVATSPDAQPAAPHASVAPPLPAGAFAPTGVVEQPAFANAQAMVDGGVPVITGVVPSQK